MSDYEVKFPAETLILKHKGLSQFSCLLAPTSRSSQSSSSSVHTSTGPVGLFGVGSREGRVCLPQKTFGGLSEAVNYFRFHTSKECFLLGYSLGRRGCGDEAEWGTWLTGEGQEDITGSERYLKATG